MRLQMSLRDCHLGVVATLLLATFAAADLSAYKVERVCEESKDLNPK